MEKKLILTDCDGVLLDWFFGFDQWMTRHGHTQVRNDTYSVAETFNLDKVEARKLTKMFNESAAIGELPPFKDAIYYVDKLYRRHGYVFDVITSQTLEPAAQKLRIANLIKHFGEGPFNKFIILDTGADKNKALKKYKGSGCYWIEDKPENAEVGLSCGLSPILVEHNHNAEFRKDTLIPTVRDWQEIYNIITGA